MTKTLKILNVMKYLRIVFKSCLVYWIDTTLGRCTPINLEPFMYCVNRFKLSMSNNLTNNRNNPFILNSILCKEITKTKF